MDKNKNSKDMEKVKKLLTDRKEAIEILLNSQPENVDQYIAEIRANYIDELQQIDKSLLILFGVSTRYLCDCGWKGKHEEMKREFDFGYDQSCCPECNNVLTNNLNWEVHCNVC